MLTIITGIDRHGAFPLSIRTVWGEAVGCVLYYSLLLVFRDRNGLAQCSFFCGHAGISVNAVSYFVTNIVPFPFCGLTSYSPHSLPRGRVMPGLYPVPKPVPKVPNCTSVPDLTQVFHTNPCRSELPVSRHKFVNPVRYITC
jgi:hypothetical protein